MTKFPLKIEGKITKGFFKARQNRYSALVKLGKEEVKCFLPNPGRLKELLIPDVEVFLKEIKSRERLTNYDLTAVKHGKVLVFIDSRMPNKLLSEAHLNPKRSSLPFKGAPRILMASLFDSVILELRLLKRRDNIFEDHLQNKTVL